jgi:secretion/DNA translocation related TadE-like protein
MLLLGATGLLVGAERARATAQAAADLAALAAAGHLAAAVGSGGTGGGTACVLAAGVAQRNGARLTSCSAGPDGVVTVRASRPAAGVGTAQATARAGPAAVRDTS